MASGSPTTGKVSRPATGACVHAGMTIKEKALALTAPVSAKPGRYRPAGKILAFLDSL